MQNWSLYSEELTLRPLITTLLPGQYSELVKQNWSLHSSDPVITMLLPGEYSDPVMWN